MMTFVGFLVPLTLILVFSNNVSHSKFLYEKHQATLQERLTQEQIRKKQNEYKELEYVLCSLALIISVPILDILENIPNCDFNLPRFTCITMFFISVICYIIYKIIQHKKNNKI